MLPISLRALAVIALVPLVPIASLQAQGSDTTHTHPAVPPCTSCAEWNAPQQPFRIFGNTYYVGTHGLGSILITSSTGHVLIDGGLPESSSRIIANIHALGFRIEDVRLILNSHVHFDHAGGIAELQRRSKAPVAASAPSAEVMRTGLVARDDPQYGVMPAITPVARLRVVADGETVRVGPVAVTAHFTPGHTRGGTSWTWRSCESGRCLDLVYADSQTPISADGFLFTRSQYYPGVRDDFQKSFAVLDGLPCGILITPHPDASGLWKRLARRDSGNADALVDTGACKRYAASAREQLQKRVTSEAGGL